MYNFKNRFFELGGFAVEAAIYYLVNLAKGLRSLTPDGACGPGPHQFPAAQNIVFDNLYIIILSD